MNETKCDCLGCRVPHKHMYTKIEVLTLEDKEIETWKCTYCPDEFKQEVKL